MFNHLENNEFCEKIRQKAAFYEEPVDGNLWERIDAELHPKRKRVWLPYFTYLAAAAAVIGLSLFFATYENDRSLGGGGAASNGFLMASQNTEEMTSNVINDNTSNENITINAINDYTDNENITNNAGNSNINNENITNNAGNSNISNENIANNARNSSTSNENITNNVKNNNTNNENITNNARNNNINNENIANNARSENNNATNNTIIEQKNNETNQPLIAQVENNDIKYLLENMVPNGAIKRETMQIDSVKPLMIVSEKKDTNEVVISSSCYTKKDSVKTNSSDKQKYWYVSLVASSQYPSFGVTLRRDLTKNISLETGVMLTRLTTDFYGEEPYNVQIGTRKYNYVGVPLKVVSRMWGNERWETYLAVGAMVEKMYKKSDTYEDIQIPNVVVALPDEDNALQWSFNVSAGVSYYIYRGWGVFVEPEFSYYFENDKQPENAYKKYPAFFSVLGGIRYKF